MKIKTLLLVILILGIFTVKSNVINREFNTIKSDTLNVPYTYWWPSGGPFTGLCGDKYSIVLTGTVIKLNKPSKPYSVSNDSSEVLYSPQKGIIKINDIKYKKAPDEGYKKTPGKSYDGEAYFSSDCFFSSGLKEGDNVIVFVYSYEGEYSIPGSSILKFDNCEAPIVKSIESYIKNNQDPLSIRKDTALWKTYGQGDALKQIIDCRLSNMNKK